ncbi:tripeptidyl-peptidase-like protein [Coniochaeta ligniaria NRRL 30616]|uniref:tripeptidyl-peptidase II n=1 Tax=Coniochaeta ligniaria NRRL 30616 TaxID=1408157 RepID=A0A1J7IYF4_9PEZI|nr:tripeptidyl-peptidase-like protein [Coniochaeta ligniaria NRRL 30616]
MLFSLAVALLGLPVLARTTAMVTLETAAEIPTGWSFNSTADDKDSITLFIALKQPKLAELKSQLVQSGPLRHRNTANHYSQQQIWDYRRPESTAVDSILSWLDSREISDRRTFDGWISFNITAQAAKALFGAELGWYTYGTYAPVLRTRRYTVPPQLVAYIDFIYPLVHFMPPRRPPVQPKPPPHDRQTTQPSRPDGLLDLPCATATFPECIRKLYNITYNATSPSPSRFGVAGFLEQYIQYEDVANFVEIYAPELTGLDPPYNFTVELLNNGSNTQDPIWMAGLEASLDIEYAMTIGYPAAVTYYSTGGRGVKLDSSGTEIPATGSDNEPYLEFLQALIAKPDDELPHVLSISYADDEQSVPRAYASRVCDLFAQLAARGVSILSASGDGGAAGTGQNLCFTNDGTGQRAFIPTFPASCPWVTAIGATENEGPPVTAAYFSAGGFSNYFGRPSWQEEAVLPYLKKLVRSNDTKIGLFNQSGRAIPDISAVGSAFSIQYGGGGSVVQGTSASTPVVAAMIALINDARLRAGKPSLGWLNPLLYSAEVRKVLSDITIGAADGCSFGDQGGEGGWAATAGYDCVTGLGVPGDFGRLLEVLG